MRRRLARPGGRQPELVVGSQSQHSSDPVVDDVISARGTIQALQLPGNYAPGSIGEAFYDTLNNSRVAAGAV